MRLKHLSILNYKNLQQVELEFSPKINCFLGLNGMGKTNLLDAIYYLSFCKSTIHSYDTQNVLHGENFFMIQGQYFSEEEIEEEVYCGYKLRQSKQFKRNKKAYTRLSDHIGMIPLIMISPADWVLIGGGSAERRKFMNVVISQYDKEYLEALIHYNKALQQRNVLLKQQIRDSELYEMWEEKMVTTATLIYQRRLQFVEEFIPIFQRYYKYIAEENEQVALKYESDLILDGFSELLVANRAKDSIIGYTSKGIHKDDLLMQLGDYEMKREGSQGQNKTYLIALKLAQFDFLKRIGRQTTPILLLDDVFDKLDAKRVKQIVQLVADENFGQIFMTDTNRDHLHRILADSDLQYQLFNVHEGVVTNMDEHEA